MNVLDWRELAPPQEEHWCDCSHCDQNGELEPIEWPRLFRMTVNGVQYVTDRYLMIRADLAPVPENYEGLVLPEKKMPATGFLGSAVTDEAVTKTHFRWHIVEAVEATGWRLVLMDHSENVAGKDSRVVGVVDANGEHIGWAMPASRIVYDERNKEHSRVYGGAA